MIKNTLAGAPCSIKEYKEYENGTKKFYGKIEVLLEDEKLTGKSLLDDIAAKVRD